ncbi:MAG: hypothetical protein J6V23_03025 [Bacteroidaceae bacterium]|nr:hypothetical protein [Bacteroidaceae bacterium]
MNKENVIKSLKFNFATSVFAALIAIAAFETGYLTKGVLALSLSEEDLYYVEVCTIILTIGIIPFAIKGFSRAMKKASNLDNIAFLKLYSKKSLQCMFLLFISLVINIFVYYGIDYDGAMYCAILSFGALLYSYPTGKIFDEYNNNSNETK